MRKFVWRLFLVSLLALFCLALARAPANAGLAPDGAFVGMANFPWAGKTVGTAVVEWELLDMGKIALAGDLHYLQGLEVSGKLAAGLSLDLVDAVKRGKVGVGYALDAMSAGWSEDNVLLCAAYRLIGPSNAGLTLAETRGERPATVDIGLVGKCVGQQLMGAQANFAFD